jgi:uncharacterized protein YlxW (UPF0749 family)
MTLPERIAELGTNIIVAAVAAIGGGVAWLVRRVLTNQAEIAMLRQHLETRDKQREEDREALVELRDDVKEIRSWIMDRK